MSKGGRYSWSGSPCPKIGLYNDFGQTLVITNNKDIVALYSYSHDKRANKAKKMIKELMEDDTSQES